MIETILLARVRKTGKQVVLMGSEKHWTELKAAFDKFHPDTHSEYDRVGLYQIVPQKKVLKLVTDDEHKSNQEKTKAGNDLQAATDKLANHSIEDLRAMAKNLDIKGLSAKASKSEIVQAIVNASSKSTPTADDVEAATELGKTAPDPEPES